MKKYFKIILRISPEIIVKTTYMYFFHVLKMLYNFKNEIPRNIVLNACQKFVIQIGLGQWTCKYLVLVCASLPRGFVGQHYPRGLYTPYIIVVIALKKTIDESHPSILHLVYNQTIIQTTKIRNLRRIYFFRFFR